MRTIEELKKLINPDNRVSFWTYMPVDHVYEVVGKDGEVVKDPYTCLHEVYFDENGDFRGATEEAKSVIGNDINDLKGSLELMIAACLKPVITEEELKLIRS